MNQVDLLKLNVNEHVEKKQNLSYLSWAWAWAEALKADPAATFEVIPFDGKPYMNVNDTGMVWVTVTMFGKNTDDDRAKLREELEDIHSLFKQVVTTHRPSLDIEAVATYLNQTIYHLPSAPSRGE